MMADLFASGRIADFILALVALEAAGVLFWRLVSGRGPLPLPFLCNLLSGAFLLLALRAGLDGSHWMWIALCLGGSLIAHLGDLFGRWNGAAPARNETAKHIPATISLRVPARPHRAPTGSHTEESSHV